VGLLEHSRHHCEHLEKGVGVLELESLALTQQREHKRGPQIEIKTHPGDRKDEPQDAVSSGVLSPSGASGQEAASLVTDEVEWLHRVVFELESALQEQQREHFHEQSVLESQIAVCELEVSRAEKEREDSVSQITLLQDQRDEYRARCLNWSDRERQELELRLSVLETELKEERSMHRIEVAELEAMHRSIMRQLDHEGSARELTLDDTSLRVTEEAMRAMLTACVEPEEHELEAQARQEVQAAEIAGKVLVGVNAAPSALLKDALHSVTKAGRLEDVENL